MSRHAAQIGLRTAVLLTLLATLVASICVGCGQDERHQSDVDAGLKAASTALVAKDPVAWFRALPPEGKPAQQAWYQTYSGLARFPWAKVSANAVPIGDVKGRYRVLFYGRLIGADTAPVICERVLDFAFRQGRLTLVGDRTDELTRHSHYMAFTHPVVMVRSHLVVVGDRSQEQLVSLLADCDKQATRVAARLHLDPETPEVAFKTLVYACANRKQASRASASRPHKNMSAGAVDGQIYVIGHPGDYWKTYAPDAVRHELTHIYAADFGDGKHLVGLLVEGLAMAVEGGWDFSGLRADVARGNRLLPLKAGLMKGDLWHGLSKRQVDLAYIEGDALVLYLEKRWGLKRTWAFADAVAASDLTSAGINEATHKSLGVTWSALYAGWKRFVRTLR